MQKPESAPHHYAQLHLEEPLIPMHFIVMYLIDKFKLSVQGHQYALTAIEY